MILWREGMWKQEHSPEKMSVDGEGEVCVRVCVCVCVSMSVSILMSYMDVYLFVNSWLHAYLDSDVWEEGHSLTLSVK